MVPFLLLNYFQYVPEYYYCEILLSDNQGMLIMGAMTYSVPMNATCLLYFYILYYMKKTKSQSILQNRQQANQRDLVVLRRIIILLGLLIILCFPAALIWFDYILTGYVNPIGYHLGWSMFTFSLSILPLTSAFLTPQLRKLLIATWQKGRQIHPIIIYPQKRRNEPMSME
jgi:magnesium-transporting ATPase (P-type)